MSAGEQEALLGSLRLDAEQKRASVEALCQGETALKERAHLQSLLKAERQRLLRDGLTESDLTLLFHKRVQGLLPLPRLTPQDVTSAELTAANKPAFQAMVWRLLGAREHIKFVGEQEAREWLEWGLKHSIKASSTEWANVAGAMRRSRQYKSAQQALDQAFAREESSRAWYERGALLDATGADVTEAEAAYRKAIELAPVDARSWNSLGILLSDKLNRHDEAEAAFRKVIELAPADARSWSNLGVLLGEKMNRCDEAEAAYHKATEFDPADAWPWGNLGFLLTDKLNRHDEAETAYLKAIELDPADAWPRNNLGNLLTDELNRHDEAETAYRKAIELDPTYALPSFNLGWLLAKLNRLEEASIAYREGAERDKDPLPLWQGQRADLQSRLCREAVRQALDTRDPAALRDA